jgi:hypothetical protein
LYNVSKVCQSSLFASISSLFVWPGSCSVLSTNGNVDVLNADLTVDGGSLLVRALSGSISLAGINLIINFSLVCGLLLLIDHDVEAFSVNVYVLVWSMVVHVRTDGHVYDRDTYAGSLLSEGGTVILEAQKIDLLGADQILKSTTRAGGMRVVAPVVKQGKGSLLFAGEQVVLLGGLSAPQATSLEFEGMTSLKSAFGPAAVFSFKNEVVLRGGDLVGAGLLFAGPVKVQFQPLDEDVHVSSGSGVRITVINNPLFLTCCYFTPACINFISYCYLMLRQRKEI